MTLQLLGLCGREPRSDVPSLQDFLGGRIWDIRVSSVGDDLSGTIEVLGEKMEAVPVLAVLFYNMPVGAPARRQLYEMQYFTGRNGVQKEQSRCF